MTSLQFMLTGSPRQQRAVPAKKVTSVFSPPLPEPSSSWGRRLSTFSRRVSVGSVQEKMDFLHVLTEHLHQRKLMPPSEREGGRVF